MSEAPSLYRRHRPRSFADVVGQEHVVRTLRNAVEQDKVHHAYLFVGSRGTGKTSMAKILAACLNCENGPTPEPCGVCDSCRAIHDATSLDVIEMDAASNNSVDDVRELRERVAYAPVSGRSKVYILDEAHMLSTQAWNAFLKTLEEPPPNTIFVLATTEAQKVLPTVADRCHRFDFARPSAQQIMAVLRRSAASESIDLPDAAAALIARHATGSFRDALGTLEQLVTYSGSKIELDDVLAVLGVADAELLFDAADAVGSGDPAGALRIVARLSESGRDPGQFFRDLEGHARALLIVQTLGEVPTELALTADHDARLVEQAERLGRAELVRLLDLLAAGLGAQKDGADARISLELAMLKAAAPEVDPTVRALLQRVERLEAQLAAGAPRPVAAPKPVSAPERPPAVPPEPQASAPVVASGGGGGAAAAAVVAEAPAPAPPEPVPAPAPPERPDAPFDLDSARSLWPAVVQTVREANAMLAALLEGARPIGLQGDCLTLGFPPSAAFLKRKAEDPEHRRAVGSAVELVCGRTVGIAYELLDTDEVEIIAPAAGAPAATLSGDEWVERFMAEFDAEEILDEPKQESESK